jgi:hypothetical protein
MKKIKIIVWSFSFLIFLSYYSCKRNTPVDDDEEKLPPGTWQSLGLENKLVSKLILDGNYLYACAGKDGLFELNLNSKNNNWRYLGLADTLVERTLESGATDFTKVDGTFIASYVASYKLQKSGIYRSIDVGQTWHKSDSGMAVTAEYPTTSVVINLKKFTDNILMAGTTTDLIYKSADAGRSWDLIYGFPQGASAILYALTFHPNQPNIIWAGGETGRFAPFLLYSTNAGANWERLYPLPPLGPYGADNAVYDIAIDPANNRTLYVGMLGLIMKTSDTAQTWKKILGWEDGIYRNWKLVINPNNADELIATGARLYRTTDGGESWEKIMPPDGRSELYALAIDWRKRILYVSTSSPQNGIYRLAL